MNYSKMSTELLLQFSSVAGSILSVLYYVLAMNPSTTLREMDPCLLLLDPHYA